MSEKKIEVEMKAASKIEVEAKAATDLSPKYLEIAERNRNKAEEAKNEAIETKHSDERGDLISKERECSLFAILFSFLALEAHINSFGFKNLHEAEWEIIKRANVELKWLHLPKIVTGESFDQKSELFKDFLKIKEYRNKLVHYKSFKLEDFVRHPSGTDVAPIYRIINSDNANLAYSTAKEMIERLNEFQAKEK